MNREVIEKILELAVYAPSGDNSQPWRFVAKDNLLQIFGTPEKDNPIFNYRNRGTLIAHGALIENIVIAAKEFGFNPDVTIFPDKQDNNHTADIILQAVPGIEKDELFPFIKKRVTNRKLYKDIALESSQKEVLSSAAGREVLWAESEQDKTKIGKAVSVNEIIMFEHKILHDSFYNDIRWTRKSERELKWGLYLHTMELAVPQLVTFKILQYWTIARLLNKVGIAKFIASQNAKQYGSASAIGVIAIPDEDMEFISGGRAMQRLWLKAASMGMAIHPVTGIVYLAQRIIHNETGSLSKTHVDIIRNAYENIVSVFPVKDQVVAMLFRLGFAPEPSDQSSRIKPEIKFV